MKKKYIIALVVVALVILGIFIFGSSSKTAEPVLEAEVVKGTLDIQVMVTGELQAKNSEMIMGPNELRNSRSLRIRDIKIQDLVPEGTVVDSGEYVATLDRSEVMNQLKDVQDDVEKIQSQYTKTQLDTTISLRNLRDELINLEFALEEAKIKLEQSKFEPPATIRQAQIDQNKAIRAFEQAKQNYSLKVKQANADMTQVSINLGQQKRKQDEMMSVLEKFLIYAPKPGMVIYYKEWGGQKRKVGSTINPWDLTVATLPDLSTMISKTYVNEIDISKIKIGQSVDIGVDAFPEKHYTGSVEQVANIGEQLPNTDAKVFEVSIKIKENDEILRPSMTTSNAIHIKQFKDVLFIPLEAVFTDDSIPVVYPKRGGKQVVLLGESNENQIIVKKGLDIGDKVLMIVPANAADLKLSGKELIPEIQARLREKQTPKNSPEKREKANESGVKENRKQNSAIK